MGTPPNCEAPVENKGTCPTSSAHKVALLLGKLTNSFAPRAQIQQIASLSFSILFSRKGAASSQQSWKEPWIVHSVVSFLSQSSVSFGGKAHNFTWHCFLTLIEIPRTWNFPLRSYSTCQVLFIVIALFKRGLFLHRMVPVFSLSTVSLIETSTNFLPQPSYTSLQFQQISTFIPFLFFLFLLLFTNRHHLLLTAP